MTVKDNRIRVSSAIVLVTALAVPRIALSQTAEELVVMRDVPYAGTDNTRQMLDIVQTKIDDSKLRPAIVFIHGGAWLSGDKRIGLRSLDSYVRSGKYVGVTVAYRLSQEAKWPAQLHDCKAALRWLHANGHRHGIDTKRMGLMGPSAGGHLVALLGLTAGRTDVGGKLGPHLDAADSVQCVVDLFGPTDFLSMNDYPSKIDHDSPNSPESRLIGGAIQDHPEKARAASPTSFVSKAAAPMLIIHGTNDDLVPYNQSVRFHQLLQDAGADSTFITIANGRHGGFRHPDIRVRIGQFFDNHLRDGKHKISAGPITDVIPKRQR